MDKKNSSDLETTELQDAHLSEMLRFNTHVAIEAQKLFSEYSETQLIWRPDAKTWNIVSCFRHLTTTCELYLPRLEETAHSVSEKGLRKSGEFKPTWFGNFFIGMLMPEKTRKLKAPKAFKPASDFNDLAVKRDFFNVQEKINEVIRSADGLDLNRTKFTSPVSRLVKLTLGEGFWLVVTHNRRHLLQAQNLTKHPGFPKA